jgi:hypothetical protein
MKKLILLSGCMILAISLIPVLATCEEEAACPKAKMSQTTMTEKHCAKAAQCPKTQNPMDDASGHSCCRMQGSCRMGQMSAMMPMYHGRMRRMMGSMGPMAKKALGHPMVKGLGKLGGPEMFVGYAEKLELSDGQVDQLTSIKHDQQKWDIQKKADIDVARVELEELLEDQPVNFDKVKSKISQVADMEKEMRLAHLTAIQKAHKVLTAEQLEKVTGFRKHHSRGMRKGPRQVIKEVIIEETTE